MFCIYWSDIWFPKCGVLELSFDTQGSKPSLPSTINPDPDMKKWFDDCTKQEPVLRPKANDLLSDISEKYSTVANQN